MAGKKGFLGKLGSVFVEEVNDGSSYNEESVSSYEKDEEESYVNANTELSDDVTEENLIEEIYANNEILDTLRSIFKVEEIKSTLPNELPTEVKRTTVSSLLNTFKLTLTEVTEDGENRMAILKEVNDHNKKVAKDEYDSLEERIESLKKEIADLEKRKIDITHNSSANSHIIEAEIERISALVNFINGGEK